MSTTRILTAAALASAIMVTAASAQTVRLRGTIDKVDGNTLTVKQPNGAPATVTVPDNVAVVGVLKASIADIKEGSYIGSGAMPQPDGTQKAVEVHIFAESQRGQGDGHRDGWDGTAYGSGVGTMTNGAVGQAVTGVEGPVITVKYQGGEKKVVVGPNTPIVRYEVGERSELKPGAAIAITAATKKPDGTFSAARINVGRNGVVPN